MKLTKKEKEYVSDCIGALNYWRRNGDEIITARHINALKKILEKGE